jgi:tetratricopeptide (TPR) repeat protein
MKLWIMFLSLMVFISSCDKLKEIGQKNVRKRLGGPEVTEEKIDRWKEKLALQESEIRLLDDKIREMVKTTKQAGALSWKIAQAYMKVGSFDLSSIYYQKAMEEQVSNQFDTANSRPEWHSFESANQFFEKAMLFKNIDEELLFEAGLSFGNAARDRGWEKERRKTALTIFKGLMKLNPDDMRYPYQIALIYFDSSITEGRIEGIEYEGYNDTEKAMKILYSILKHHESLGETAEMVPILFTLANFHYKKGDTDESEKIYTKIKKQLEIYSDEGKITNLNKNPSYLNVVKNLKKIKENKESKLDVEQ